MPANNTFTFNPAAAAEGNADVEDAVDAASEDMTYTEKVVVMVILSIMSVVGTIGNALAIYVFANLKQKLTSTIFILTLAGTDFLTCLITIPFTITMEYLKFRVEIDIVCKAYHFLVTTTVPFSCVVIVAIAVDRYMCICHPFYHWMTIRRARIIVLSMGVVIFLIGAIVAIHYKTSASVIYEHTKNITITTQNPMFPNDSSSLAGGGGSGGGAHGTFVSGPVYTMGVDHTFSPLYSQRPDYSHHTVSVNRTEVIYTSPVGGGAREAAGGGRVPSPSPTQRSESVTYKAPEVPSLCQVDKTVIHEVFFSFFRSFYVIIFLLSCIIVLVLYSLIYRSVIAQRKKKLRIKSAQCCLLWNAASVETPHHETLEMTQDIELSHTNGGEDRGNNIRRQSEGTAEEKEAAISPTGASPSGPSHTNGAGGSAARKSSLSNARIERMRVANIKTAGTLFVVTIVFIIAFLPAWLMSLAFLPMNVIIFYMYFIYNVVNPFIYAFLNQNFKTELKRIIQCRQR